MIDDALDDLSRAVTSFGLDPVLGAVVNSLVSHDDRWANDPRWYEPFGTATIPSFTVGRGVDAGSNTSASELLGAVHEGLRSRSDRRRNGAVYTPAAVADRLVEHTLAGLDSPATVCDPAAGGGAFLLATARALRAAGVGVDEIVGERLWGADIDSSAVAVARTALALWAWQETGEPLWVPSSHLVVADPLLAGPRAWPEREGRGFDAVVGNPPFQGQLHADTARQASGAQAIASRLGLGRLGYADTAALFLVLGCELVRPGGRVGLIQPQSVLAARDAAGVRRAVGERADLLTLWVEADGVFEAEVRVWAPVLQRRDDRAAGPNVPIDRVVGREFRAAPATARPRRSHGSSWAPLVADLLGGPPLDLEAEGRWSGRLADVATATAGFRDQFYGLVPYVVDASTLDDEALTSSGTSTHVPLITAGAIDPLRSRWGIHPARFAGQSWPRPLVDRAALARGDAKLSQWVDARLVPKLLVAPQTTVLEVLPDPLGCMVPSTPVVAVAVTDPEAVARVAAMLASPPASAWVFRQSAGTGLSSGALRVPARTMLQIPLPADEELWAEGARLSMQAMSCAEVGDADRWVETLDQLARTMTAAYGLSEEHDVVSWWRDRRPAWR